MIEGLFVYIYLALAILALYFETPRERPKYYIRVWNFVYFSLALLAAFSYKVGPDTQSYMDDFFAYPSLSNLSANVFLYTRSQPLYVLTCSLCKTIYNDFILLQLLQIFLIYHSLFLLLKRLDLRKFWVLFLFLGYCYFALLSARRESLGLAFCLYAMLFFMKRKWIQYYLLVTVGFLFHSGMILFLVFPFISLFKKLSMTNIIILATLVFCIQYGFDVLQSFSGFVNEDDTLMRYSIEKDGSMRLSTMLLLTVELIIMMRCFIYNKRNYKGYEKDFIFISLFSIMMTYLIGVLPILYRYRVHFAVFQYFALQECFRAIKKDTLTIAFVFMVFCYSPIVTFTDMIRNSPSTYYYCSVFSSDDAKYKMDMFRNQYKYE